jgi:glycosyltransferase involved in cell wall biosynthesis
MAERVALIIPALNEEPVIRETLAGFAAAGLTQIIVVDNGSTDRTGEVAKQAGAQVVREPRRGYGQACLAGTAALAPDVSIVAFTSADGSDDPADLPGLLLPIEQGVADLVLGSRTMGECEPGALTPAQRFGNWLATRMLRAVYGVPYTDLGPFRAVRRHSLEQLAMRDTGFGWTIEMQIKAHRAGLRVVEVPAHYRMRRSGKSKISGTLYGTALAGFKILWTILRLRGKSFHHSSPRH